MKEAMFYEKKEGGLVQCHLCAFNCLIGRGKIGRCRVRKNIEGKLYSLVYDKINTKIVNPIEKKPLYHFAVGSNCFSISTVGCNWQCKFCCNWQISAAKEIEGEKITPQEIVRIAQKSNSQGLSYTFTEPTIFYELSYETAEIAHQQGLYNTWVTNGYTNPPAIKKIAPYLDAVTVDFKGSGEKGFLKKFANVPSAGPIYCALLEYKKQKVHTEITDLIVPKIGDDETSLRKMIKWIKRYLGEETPIHFLRFFPTYEVLDLPATPIETLEKAYELAKKAGMKYVYLGNVEGEKNNTYCPKCNRLLIERVFMSVTRYQIKDGACPFCGEKINIKGEKWIKKLK